MSKKYKHIFFDLDHTLWDFEKNSSEVLSQLYDEHHLKAFLPFSKESFLAQFKITNDHLWSLYNTRTISKENLRDSRFNLIFSALAFRNDVLSKRISSEYLRRCPEMPYTFPFTREVLTYLKNEKQYELHILTNGFEDVQHLKLNAARISQYFSEVITSDIAGYQKPEKGYFSYALTKTLGKCEECVMIGDNLEVDIIGARNATIDQIYFNPKRVKHKETITYEISCLSELLLIF